MELLSDYSLSLVQGHPDTVALEEGVPLAVVQAGVDTEQSKFEFMVLKRLTQTQHHFNSLQPYDPEVWVQNRYASVVPFCHNVLSLPLLDHETHPSQGYLNASIINITAATDYFIQTQGPLEQTIGQFWKCVWYQNVKHIFMLCMLKFQSTVQCAQYWPERPGDKLVWPSTGEPQLQVELSQVIQEQGEQKLLVQRVFRLSCRQNGEWTHREVVQMQMRHWKDNEVPLENKFEVLHTMFQTLEEHLMARQQGLHMEKVLVHCSAGIGRTGTFICIFDQLQLLKQQKGEEGQVRLSVFRGVRQVREQRWGMIKNESQYHMIYQYLRHHLNN